MAFRGEASERAIAEAAAEVGDWSDTFVEATLRQLVLWCTTENVAGVACLLGAIHASRRIVWYRPRPLLLAVSLWTLWLLVDLTIGRGYADGLADIVRRGGESCEASRQLARGVVRFVTAWLDFLLPFISDIAVRVVALWRQLTPQQRWLLLFAALAAYAVVETARAALETARAARRHTGTIKAALFQSSFLGAGPFMWHVGGFLPADAVAELLGIIVTALPAVFSLYEVRAAVGRSERGGDAETGDATMPHFSADRRHVWLSYWACWPVLASAEAAISWLPEHHFVALPSADATSSWCHDLQRGMFVLVVWLQFWQGHRLFDISRLLCASVGALRRTLPGASAGMRPRLEGLGKVSCLTGFLDRHGRAWLVFAALGGVALIWLFYSAIKLLSDVLRVLAWSFVAIDTADLLLKGQDDFYTKRLSFWVMAILWDGLLRLPVIGGALDLFTPVAFSLLYVASEETMRWLVMPLLDRLCTLIAGFSPQAHKPGSPEAGPETKAEAERTAREA